MKWFVFSSLYLFAASSLVWAQECETRFAQFKEVLEKKKYAAAEKMCLSFDFQEQCHQGKLRCLRVLRDHYLTHDKWKQALYFAETVLKRKDSEPKDAFQVAQVFVGLDKPGEAVPYFERAEKDPQLWSSARYNRLLILEGNAKVDHKSLHPLWMELVKRSSKSDLYPMAVIGFVFHLLELKEDKKAYGMLKKIKPLPGKLTATDRHRLDTLFYRLSFHVNAKGRKEFNKRWKSWVTRSPLRTLVAADLSLQKGKWTESLKRTNIFLKDMEERFDQLLPWAGRANLFHGIALSRLGKHERAAKDFDLCATQGMPLCEGWLARECAYLGRWDLAYTYWSKKLSADDGLDRATKKRLQHLIAQAKANDAEDMIEKRWEYPHWMRTRF